MRSQVILTILLVRSGREGGGGGGSGCSVSVGVEDDGLLEETLDTDDPIDKIIVSNCIQRLKKPDKCESVRRTKGLSTICCMGAFLNINFIRFLVFVVTASKIFSSTKM